MAPEFPRRVLSPLLSSSAAEREGPRTYGSRLWLRSRGHVRVVDVDEIEWIGSDLRYSWVHLRGGTDQKIREPIGHIESRLDPARFTRVHRTVIVNLDCVAEATSSARAKEIVLKDGTRLPMSRSGRRRLLGSPGLLR